MAAPCRSCLDGRSNSDGQSPLTDNDIRGVPNDAEGIGWTDENASAKSDVTVVEQSDHPISPTNARRERSGSGDVEIMMAVDIDSKVVVGRMIGSTLFGCRQRALVVVVEDSIHLLGHGGGIVRGVKVEVCDGEGLRPSATRWRERRERSYYSYV